MSGPIYPTARTWNVWFHDLLDERWELDSYENICTIGSLYDYYLLTARVHDFKAGMFFLIKDGATPLWEDKAHKAYWSVRVPRNDLDRVWRDIVGMIVGESLIADERQMAQITGASISAKKFNVVVRIWTADKRSKARFTPVDGVNWSEAWFKEF